MVSTIFPPTSFRLYAKAVALMGAFIDLLAGDCELTLTGVLIAGEIPIAEPEGVVSGGKASAFSKPFATLYWRGFSVAIEMIIKMAKSPTKA